MNAIGCGVGAAAAWIAVSGVFCGAEPICFALVLIFYSIYWVPIVFGAMILDGILNMLRPKLNPLIYILPFLVGLLIVWQFGMLIRPDNSYGYNSMVLWPSFTTVLLYLAKQINAWMAPASPSHGANSDDELSLQP